MNTKRREDNTKRPDSSNRPNRPRRSSANRANEGPLNIVGDMDKENFAYRVVNDEGNRVELMKSYGYDVVSSEDISFSSGNAVKTGSAVSVVVDKQTGKKGVLMRQPIEFHEEDKVAKAKAVDKTEESMLRKLKTDEGRYGEVESTNSLSKSNDD